MISYLGLNDKQNIHEKQAIYLVTTNLHMINLKEYSLTRRVYTYLFGPPNIDGIYEINVNKRSYEISILYKTLDKMLSI